MNKVGVLLMFVLVPVLAGCAEFSSLDADHSISRSVASGVTGVLRVSTTNPRYFADGSGKAVYLTGTHTWTGLIDRGPTDPPPPFDFDRYLDFLQSSNHNFIRLWSRHVTRYQSYGRDVLYGAPLPWARTGPGMALDGKPRFDLGQFDDQYFTRLRDRVVAARDPRNLRLDYAFRRIRRDPGMGGESI